MAIPASQISTQKSDRQWMASERLFEGVGNINSCRPEMQMQNMFGARKPTCLDHMIEELERADKEFPVCVQKTRRSVDQGSILRDLGRPFTYGLRRAHKNRYSSSGRVCSLVRPLPRRYGLRKFDALMCEMDRAETLLEKQDICPEGTHEVEEETTVELQLKDLNISGFKLDKSVLQPDHDSPAKENLASFFLPDGDDTDGGGDEEEEEMEEQVICQECTHQVEETTTVELQLKDLNISGFKLDKSVLQPDHAGPAKEKLASFFLPDDDDTDGGGDDEKEEEMEEQVICQECTHHVEETTTVELQIKDLNISGFKLDKSVLQPDHAGPAKEKLASFFLPDDDDTGDGGDDEKEEEMEEQVICQECTHQVEETTTVELQIKDLNISGFKLDKSVLQPDHAGPAKEKLASFFLPDDDDTDGGGDDEKEEEMEEQVICQECTHQVEETTTVDLQLKDLNISGFKLDKLILQPDPAGTAIEKLESSFIVDDDDTDGAGDDEKEEEMDSDNSPMEEQVRSIGSKFVLEMVAETVLVPAYLSTLDMSIVEPVSSRLEVHDHEEIDRGKSDEQLTMEKEEMAAEEEDFMFYRSDWESSWGSDGCGFFEDMTQVSSMHFTHLTPKRNTLDNGIMESTLQIFSIKLTEIKGGFKWPLSVYGVVAARDAVDHNRNLLFCCNRRRSQKIKQDDPFLRLVGPSRAIVFTDPVEFEIQLKVQFGALTQDRALISGTYHYAGRGHGVKTICFENCFCKVEISLERVVETVQATICSVRVVKQGSQLFKYGCRVACSMASCSCVLIDEGYVDLDRRVVSVQLDGSLEVVIQAYSVSGDIAEQGQVFFTPKSCSVSQDKCYVGDTQVEISVAWSLLVENKRYIAGNGWVFETSHLDH
ncbi:uncharacterized protein LOC124688474 isoform X2 [Lolium rigidum]|uniref:uncharacterized protein LOC124688474 isoform X2 n=1 Tax=Lolium rigidum TaxID=89674 RepID=UPI001F5C5AE3|nr:uncharacterized protein LOC124688474 isoform X2 [Lolium rigidum]